MEFKNNDIKISVIIPNYNRAKSLVKSIKSVLDQSFIHFEIIVVDDCSTDNSLIEITKFKDTRLRVFKLEKNSGAAAARNYGIIKSTAPYISFLDSDDTFEKDFLKVSYKTLSITSEDIGFMWSGYRLHFQNSNRTVEKSWVPDKDKSPYLTFLKDISIGAGAGVTLKREVFKKCGSFDESLPAAEDTEFFLRITQHYDFTYTDKVLINIYRDSGDRLSKNFEKIAIAYNKFIPAHWREIKKKKDLTYKYSYKLMWLNFHLKDKKLAYKYFLHAFNAKKSSLKNIMIFLLYFFLPLNCAKKIHTA
tara:strand:- start:194 stop:1108 length:915 start_codon:yes stop_codon:yes gene_type:complete